jgi:hypothetical protein
MTFLASLARVLRRRRLDARLTFGPVIQPQGRTRRELAAVSQAFVTLALDREATAAGAEVLPLPRAA